MTNAVNLASAAGTGFAFRNRIINGAMEIDQRLNGASFSGASGADNYTLDRWAIGHGSPVNAITAQRSTTAPDGFKNSLYILAGTGASAGAAGYAYARHVVEGNNIADLGWGTASAKSITISFWVRSSITGTFGFVIRNSAANRGYGATYSISSANTFEYKTITIPGDTSGTWLTDSSSGLTIIFDLGVGSNYNISSGSWGNTTNPIGVTGAVKLTATTGATWYITGVQLEVGSVATPFERRPYGIEDALCKRYYRRINGNPSSTYTAYGVGIAQTTTTVSRMGFGLDIQMRATPSVSITNAVAWDSNIGGATAISVNYSTPVLVDVDLNTSGLAGTSRPAKLLLASNGYIEVGAEL